MRAQLITSLVVLLTLSTPSAFGLMLIPPVNLMELAGDSDLVVLAEAQGADVIGDEFLATLTTFTIKETLHGAALAGTRLVVETPGGVGPGHAIIVPGTPEFVTGERYLLCLVEMAPGVWVPRTASYGVLIESTGVRGAAILEPISKNDCCLLPRPDGRAVEPIGVYAKAPLLAHLRDCLTRGAPWSRDLVESDEPGRFEATPGGCAYFAVSGFPLRWFQFGRGESITMSADSGNDDQMDAIALVPAALATWNNIASSDVRLNWGGAISVNPDCASASTFTAAGNVGETIVFNDPCGSIPDLTLTGGVAARGGVRIDLDGDGMVPTPSSRHDGACRAWIPIESWHMLVNNGIVGPFGISTAAEYSSILAHELGHGLGFDHVPDATALMAASCCNQLGATDITCARFAYPDSIPNIESTPSPAQVIDFGAIPVGQSTTAALSYTSNGTVTLDVSQVVATATGGDNAANEISVVAAAPVSIDACANATIPVTLRYAPTGLGAQDTGFLDIHSNDPDTPVLRYSWRGTGAAPLIEVIPAPAEFGNTALSASRDEVLRVHNRGSLPLEVSSLSITGGNASSEFSLVGAPASATIQPGTSLAITARFSPSQSGARSSNLRVVSNALGQATLMIPLRGTGVSAEIGVSHSSIAFGEVALAETSSEMLSIRNLGDVRLTITRIALAAGSSTDFRYIGPASRALDPGDLFAATIEYSPDAPGADTGALRIESDDPTTPLVEISLSGSGGALPGGLQRPGDCNQDGTIDISDGVCLLAFLFGGGRPLPCGDGDPAANSNLAVLDWNTDGGLDLSDAVSVFQFLFSGGSPHRGGVDCLRVVDCPSTCVD